MKKLLLFIAALITIASMAAAVKFTPDQCRVLQQMKINTTGICPPPKSSKK